MAMRFEHLAQGTDETAFDPSLVKTVSGRVRSGDNKPNGGLWASPVVEEYGESEWFNYLRNEMWDDPVTGGFRFDISDDAKVLWVDEQDKTSQVPLLTEPSARQPVIDWKGIVGEYDAVYVDWEVSHEQYRLFGGWQVSTLVVINPEIVENLEPVPAHTFTDPGLY